MDNDNTKSAHSIRRKSQQTLFLQHEQEMSVHSLDYLMKRLERYDGRFGQ